MRIRLTSALVLIGLLFLFAIQNAKVVEVVFLFWTFEVSRALLLFVVFVIGGVVGWFLKTSAYRHRKRNSSAPKEDR